MMRTRFLIGLAVAAGLQVLTAGTPAVAQIASIPAAVKSSPQPERATIQAFIADRAQRIAGTDAAARTAARDALIDESGVGAQGAAAPAGAYIDLYLDELNTELLRLLDNPSLEVRLNGIIVAARLARGDRNARLTPVIIKALDDKSAPVLLWGMKAAADALPLSLSNPLNARNNPLLAKVGTTARAHPRAMFVGDAYDALTLTASKSDPLSLQSRYPEPVWKTMVPLVVPELDRLWGTRLDLMASADAPDPAAEIKPLLFFTEARTWSALDPQAKFDVVQLAHDQLLLAGQRAAQESPEREVYVNLVRRTAGFLMVVAEKEGAPGVRETGARIQKAVESNTAGPVIIESVELMLPALQAVPKFAKIQASRKVAPGGGTTGPS